MNVAHQIIGIPDCAEVRETGLQILKRYGEISFTAVVSSISRSDLIFSTRKSTTSNMKPKSPAVSGVIKYFLATTIVGEALTPKSRISITAF